MGCWLDFNSGVNSLVTCCCNTWQTEPCLSHDTLVIKVNSVDRLSWLDIGADCGLLYNMSGILFITPVVLYSAWWQVFSTCLLHQKLTVW